MNEFLSAATHLNLTPAELEFLERSLKSDAAMWEKEVGRTRDLANLLAEKNVFRYRPVPVTVRAEDGEHASLLRVVAAGVLAGARLTVSTPAPLDDAIAGLLSAHGVSWHVHDAQAWRNLLRTTAPGRVRLLGGSREVFADACDGRADIALYAQPVVEAGRVELLTFLREQAISVTAHRFGSPTALVDGLLDAAHAG